MNCHSLSLTLQDDPDGGVLATFLDVPEAIAHGVDRTDALAQAKNALAVALFGYLKEGRCLPTPSWRAGEQLAPQATDVLKIAVIEAWTASELSKSEFAKLLGINEKEARCILDPDAGTKANRLEMALAALGRKLHLR